MEVSINKGVLALVEGDITEERTEAIVNAANSGLRGGAGVDGAIHSAGGPSIMEQCRRIGGCPTGQAVITTGGDLKAPFVIHTVGPVYQGGEKGEAALLRSAYDSSLRLAAARGLRSIAFPAISTGVYGYPLAEAARIALQAAIYHLRTREDLQLIRFVLFNRRTYEVFAAALAELI
jgi:O-acetyl-ADP-ribose deacetylase (regulator of RNase III)